MIQKLPSKKTLLRQADALFNTIAAMRTDHPLKPVWPGLPPDPPILTDEETEIYRLRKPLSEWLKAVKRVVNGRCQRSEKEAFRDNGLVRVTFSGNQVDRSFYSKSDCLADLQWLIALVKGIGAAEVVPTNTREGNLATRLRQARKRAGQSQLDAAEEIEVDIKAYGQYELGKRQPRRNRSKIEAYIERYSPE